MLTSFKIQNFRPFRHLQIERLGQINLIAGKNNVGKSSLLEALRLYAHRGAPAIIWEILSGRNEISRSSDANSDNGSDIRLSIEHLFYGRKQFASDQEPIQIGPVDSMEDTLSIAPEWHFESRDENGTPLNIDFFRDEEAIKELQTTGLTIRMGSQFKKKYSLRFLMTPRAMTEEASTGKEINCAHVSANGLNKSEIGRLWDNIALTDLEQDVLAALRIIAPEVERLSLLGEPKSGRGRIAVVKTAGHTRPIPLNSMGDGMNRIFGYMLALVNARDGILLIDEIENGIHYSVQPNLWASIFNAAYHLNVQVFATTHSWDCITSFQKVASESKEIDGMLIRLEAKREMTNAVLFDERELSIVSRDQIEVR